jgi:hypothetical protein
MPVWLNGIFDQVVEASKRHKQSVTSDWEECNKYDLTGGHPVSDSWTVMIGPGGLLLVVSHLLPICNPSFSFMGVGLEKSKIT